MNVHLMYQNKEFNWQQKPCFGKETLAADLELECILKKMAQGDEVILQSCRTALFHPLQSVSEIVYRQKNLKDTLQQGTIVRKLYSITLEAEKRRKQSWYWLSSTSTPASLFSGAIDHLKIYLELLMELRKIADDFLPDFQSEGFRELFSMFQRELDDRYFSMARSQLDDLDDDEEILVSAKLGNCLQGVSYVFRHKTRRKFWQRWKFAQTYYLAPRDDAGAADLEKRRERAVKDVTNALVQSEEQLKGFFEELRNELAFYVGCLNAAEFLKQTGMAICIPVLFPAGSRKRVWKGLYDSSLAFIKKETVTGNNLETSGKSLYLITGANQGGKSTFLRSIGQAQLMAQCGMFVSAEYYAAPVCSGIFSHFNKEEDSSMKSGKLDEELSRMDELVDYVEKNALVLMNESFASTNEREGSEIGRQITQALVENQVEVFSVTHLYTYAVAFADNSAVQYLRAERMDNGERSFKIVPGEPLKTAFGEDLYRKIFISEENNPQK